MLLMLTTSDSRALWKPHTCLPEAASGFTAILGRPMNYIQLLLPDFSLILLGYLVCQHTALNRTVWVQVDSLVYYFLFPVLLFHSIVKNPLDLAAASSLIAAGLVLSAVSIALAYLLPYLPGLGRFIDRRQHAASAQVAFRFNSFIALALAERMAGQQGLLLIAVLIGVCVPLFNAAAVWPMVVHNGKTERSLAGELLRNPLILATASGLAANLLGFRLPVWLEPTVTRLGAASLALGLLAAGAGMQLSSLRQGKVLAVCVLGIRHFALPLVAWALCKAFALDAVQSTVLLAFSALPTASSAYILAAKMGYDGAYVAGLVTLSTALGVLSLPFALGVLR